MKIVEDQNEGAFKVSYPGLLGVLPVGETVERAVENALDARKVWFDVVFSKQGGLSKKVCK